MTSALHTDMEVERLAAIIDGYETAMVETCCHSISFDSVKGADAGPGQPFGLGIAGALEHMLRVGEALGFTARNVDGYAGHLEMGQGAELVGILAHLDVVPAGTGWSVPPFAGTVADGRIIGRGAIDNKGPAVAALYAMKAVSDLGTPLSRRVRLILGTDEESSWECMAHYFRAEEQPCMSFTPDGAFPIVGGEKGLLGASITWRSQGAGSAGSAGTPTGLAGGTALNAVPALAEAQFRGLPLHAVDALRQLQEEYVRETGKGVELAINSAGPGGAEDVVKVIAHGKAAHGSTPEEGRNAILVLADFLIRAHDHFAAQSHSSSFLSGAPLSALRWLVKYVGDKYDGSNLGIATHHDPLGDLTLNVGTIAMDGNTVIVGLDSRFPFGIDADRIFQAVQASLGADGQVELRAQKGPIYLPSDAPLIQALSRAYVAVTGEVADSLCMGGTTYAKALAGCVAFGALFPGGDETAHQADESWPIADMVKSAKVFAHAILELAGPSAK